MQDAWLLRLRSGQGPQVELTLDDGPKTTLEQLRAIISKALSIPSASLAVKFGFPPKQLLHTVDDSDNKFTAEEAATTVVAAGLADRDVVIAQGAAAHTASNSVHSSGESLSRKARKARKSTPYALPEGFEFPEEPNDELYEPGKAPVKQQRKRAKKFAGVGRRLGSAADSKDGETAEPAAANGATATATASPSIEPGGTTEPGSSQQDAAITAVPQHARDNNAANGAPSSSSASAPAAQPSADKPQSSAAAAADKPQHVPSVHSLMNSFSTLQSADATLGNAASATDAAEASFGAALASAAWGSGESNQTSLQKALRRSLKDAMAQRGAWTVAEGKVAAAMAGKVTFTKLDGFPPRLSVQWMKGQRSSDTETIPDLPAMLVGAVLRAIVADNDDKALENLTPVNMAMVSPRIFWAVVRHGKVGPGTSFITALEALAAGIDWKTITAVRKKTVPDRFGDYVDADALDLDE